MNRVNSLMVEFINKPCLSSYLKSNNRKVLCFKHSNYERQIQ